MFGQILWVDWGVQPCSLDEGVDVSFLCYDSCCVMNPKFPVINVSALDLDSHRCRICSDRIDFDSWWTRKEKQGSSYRILES